MHTTGNSRPQPYSQLLSLLFMNSKKAGGGLGTRLNRGLEYCDLPLVQCFADKGRQLRSLREKPGDSVDPETMEIEHNTQYYVFLKHTLRAPTLSLLPHLYAQQLLIMLIPNPDFCHEVTIEFCRSHTVTEAFPVRSRGHSRKYCTYWSDHPL